MLKKILNTVKQAGEIFAADFEVKQKGNEANMVTTNDVAVQNFLCGELGRIIDDLGFICEESDISGDIFSHKFTAVIDPIDGTANYVRGMPECGISVAIYKDAKPYIGVVFMPRINKIYYAQAGCGAYMNGERIHVSDKNMQNSIYFTAFSSYYKEYAAPCFDIARELFCQINDIRRLGSAAGELCYIAEGVGEMLFEAHLEPWDFAAGALILKEAGGHCCEINFEKRKNNYTQPFFAASDKNTFLKLKAAVEKHFTAEYYNRQTGEYLK